MLGLRAHQAGDLALHCAAIRTSDGIIGFLGRTHAGKSTAALLAVKSGARFWTDDVLVIDARGLGRPGGRVAGRRTADGRRARPVVLPVGRRRPSRIARFVVVGPRRDDGWTVRPLEGHRKLRAILANVYVRSYPPPPRSWHERLLELADRVPVVELRAPQGLPALRRAWPAIWKELAK